MQGLLVYEKNDVQNQLFSVESKLGNGTYVVQVTSNDTIFSELLVGK